jgi:DNA-binding NtrC family response regulator
VELARRFAPTELPILLIGATGTGKELLTQHIHRWSGRAGKLVDVNCAAIPQDIADSILFGHRRGAFSGAIETRVGLMEDADGGTLFLDELCSLPLAIQGKLLRVLESGAVRRVGDTTMRRAGFRAICATQVRLDPRVAAGSFRMDLLQRLGGIQIELPPLSERGRDIVLLAHAFAATVDRRITTDGDMVLLAHRWPGNVRELRWAVERAHWLTHEPALGAAVLEYAIALGETGSHPGHGARPAPEEVDLLAVCEAHGWDASRVAEAMGIHRTTLWRRLRALGISLRRRKGNEPGAGQTAPAAIVESWAVE